jgi:hypothetical protein
MTTDLNSMLGTFRSAEMQYRLTGDPKFKPAADRAKSAIETYLSTLSNRLEERERQLKKYVDSKTGTPAEVTRLSKESEKIRQNTNKVASDYLVSSNLVEPIPVDWSQYYVKGGIVVGLVAAVAFAVLVK